MSDTDNETQRLLGGVNARLDVMMRHMEINSQKIDKELQAQTDEIKKVSNTVFAMQFNHDNLSAKVDRNHKNFEDFKFQQKKQMKEVMERQEADGRILGVFSTYKKRFWAFAALVGTGLVYALGHVFTFLMEYFSRKMM